MAKRYGKYPKMKEVNPGYPTKGKDAKVKMIGNPLGVKVIKTNPTKKGGIFGRTKKG